MKSELSLSIFYSKIITTDSLIGGLKVFISLAPSAVLMSIILGAIPVIGIYAALMAGVLCVFTGAIAGFGKSASIAIVSVAVTMAYSYGPIYIIPLILFTCIVHLILTYLHLRDLLRLIPRNVIISAVNVFALINYLLHYGDLNYFTTNWWPGTTVRLLIILAVFNSLGLLSIPKLSRVIPTLLTAILIIIGIVFIIITFSKPIESNIARSNVFALYPSQQVELTIASILWIIPYAIAIAVLDLIDAVLNENNIQDSAKTVIPKNNNQG